MLGVWLADWISNRQAGSNQEARWNSGELTGRLKAVHGFTIFLKDQAGGQIFSGYDDNVPIQLQGQSISGAKGAIWVDVVAKPVYMYYPSKGAGEYTYKFFSYTITITDSD